MFDAGKGLCDVLIEHQVADEGSADFGGILCRRCGVAHPRAGEAVFPFCYFYSETKKRKYIEAAARLVKWLFRRQSPDGSWGEGSGAEKGDTVFLTTALCHAYQLAAGELTCEEKGMLERMIRGGAEYVYGAASIEWAERGEPGINCFVSSCPALQLAYGITGEEKYRQRARDNALSGMERINEDGFLVGEGAPGLREGFPSVDVARNLEVGLGALLVYGRLSGNESVRDAVVRSLETHLNFFTPSGYIDDSWGTRMHEWTLLGNKDGKGCQAVLMPLRNFDARFQRAAGQNLRYMVKNMMKDGLVTAGPHAKDEPGFVPCIEPSVARANAVCEALLYCGGVPLKEAGKSVLPTEEKGWVRFYRSVNVLQVRTSALLCTITGYPAGGAGTAAGGTISHLWHGRFGTVQAASRATNGRRETGRADEFSPSGWLTPRIEAVIDGEVFSNVFEGRTAISVRGDGVRDDVCEVGVAGRLKSAGGKDSGLAYTIMYHFEGSKISKEITVEGDREAKLRSIEPIVFERGCELLALEGAVEVRHPRGSSCIVAVSGESARIRKVSRDAIVWSSFPALYALPIVIEATKRGTRARAARRDVPARKISYSVELRDWE